MERGGDDLFSALDALQAPIYVTDADGVVTHFNQACIGFAGRTPAVGKDRWCVTWKLYTDEGAFLPHDQCPMALAIHEKHVVRGVTAVAAGGIITFNCGPKPVTIMMTATAKVVNTSHRIVLDGGVEDAQEIHALDMLHRQEIGGPDLAVAERLYDVRMVQVDGDLGLVLEHLAELRRLRQRRMDLLDDEDLGQALRQRLARQEELGHAAGAESTNELIFSEGVHSRR